MRALGLLIATFALAVAPAAAAPWSQPRQIAGAPDAFPIVADSAGGPQALYWGVFDLPNLQAPVASFVSVLGPGLAPGAVVRLSPSLNISQATIYGGRVALGTFGSASSTSPGSVTGVATGLLGGPMKVHALPAEVRSISGNAAGDLAVLIEHCATNVSGCRPSAPAVVVDRPGRGFSKPITLDRKGHSFGGSLTIDAHGRVLAAWDRAGVIYARFISIAGKLSAIQRLGYDTGLRGLDVVLSGDGRAAVGWTSQSVSEGDATSDFTAQIALAGSSSHFHTARTVDTVSVLGTGRYIAYQGLVVRLPAGQPGLAAWTGYDGAHYTVQAASINATTIGPPQTVSTPGTDTVLADAAEGAHGQAVILLLPGRAGADPVIGTQADGLIAVTHPPGTQTFSSPEQILPGPAYVDGATVSIDTPTGGVLATWRNAGSPASWAVRTPLA